jgi:Transposase DDE domain
MRRNPRTNASRTVQRRLESYGMDSTLRRDFVTITLAPRVSRVQRSESPAFTPRTSTTVDGTVVRRESDRSIARTSLDSIGFDTACPGQDATRIHEGCGQHVVRQVKYSRVVGQQVGRQMQPNDPRERKAIEMLLGGLRIAEGKSPGKFIVASQSGTGFYTVEGVGVEGGFESCSCPDFDARLAACKHIRAVRHWIFDNGTQPGETVPLVPIPKRGKTINWGLYTKAQTEEYLIFNRLLRELTLAIPEPDRDPKIGGRPSVPLREQAFGVIQKCYSGFSYRRSQGFRVEAAARGQLSRAPHWEMGSRFLCRPDITEILHSLLGQSALPLIALESKCAVDSTGLRTSRFNYYRKEKYEPERENDWKKFHALVGIETHVIAVAEVTEGSVNDYPIFQVLLRKANSFGFRFKEVYADKAYNGRTNVDTAVELGMEPYIPFKVNSTGRAGGSPAYHRMYRFFQYHRPEFDTHYRQRAQVESTFGAFKTKLGETIASRVFTSQINEVLCLAISYNLTILVRQMFERGLFPDFLTPATPARRPSSPTEESIHPPVSQNLGPPGAGVVEPRAIGGV